MVCFYGFMFTTKIQKVFLEILESTGLMKYIPYEIYPKNLKSVVMILPQVHLRKPCYDFTFL